MKTPTLDHYVEGASDGTYFVTAASLWLNGCTTSNSSNISDILLNVMYTVRFQSVTNLLLHERNGSNSTGEIGLGTTRPSMDYL